VLVAVDALNENTLFSNILKSEQSSFLLYLGLALHLCVRL
jgi:hypothetical protein